MPDKIKVLCKYAYINCNKDKLPLFISFCKNNLLVLTLEKEVVDNSDKFDKLKTLLENWFTEFKVVAIYYKD